MKIIVFRNHAFRISEYRGQVGNVHEATAMTMERENWM
jgi:hypothetical protein